MASDPASHDQAAALAQDGRNRIQALVGPMPDAASTLRSAYLAWADTVERFLAEHGPGSRRQDADLHSARHRDIVNGTVPDDVLVREVLAERDVRLRLLDALVEQHAATTAGVEVQGRKGEVYRYFPDRPLGRGGYGLVFEATTVDGLELAVKRVSLRLDGGTARWMADGRLAERELHVARRLDRLGGGGVLPLLDDALEEDAFLFVMPRAEFSLEARLAGSGPLDEQEARRLVLDLAHALRTLADAGVVHRDIKPGNVLWWRGRWVLSDLGVARVVEEATSTYTWAGTGSHDYWAPELFAFEDASIRSDLYALGCTALEALTGTKPFTGDLATAHRDDAPPLPTLTDRALERTIRRLLKKDKDGRPADARQVEQMLVPAEGLGADQSALLRAVARDARRADERAHVDREAEREAGLRRDARAAFEGMWEDAVARAQAVVPEATSSWHDDTWFLVVGRGRLSVQLFEPSGGRGALLIGLVRVMFLDEPRAASNVANVRCRQFDGSPVWEILRFEHNMISTERPPLGPRRADLRAGMGLSNLDALVDRLDTPGPPLVSMDVVLLTGESLLSELAAELDL